MCVSQYLENSVSCKLEEIHISSQMAQKKRNINVGGTRCVTPETATHNPIYAIMSRVPLDTTRYRANNFLRAANLDFKKSNVRYITLLRLDRPTGKTNLNREIPHFNCLTIHIQFYSGHLYICENIFFVIILFFM